VKLCSYFKLSLKKQFVELNSVKTFPEASSLKQPLKGAIVNMIEIYHFFRYNQNKLRRVKNESYNRNLWETVIDANHHFKKNIFATVDFMTQINVRNLVFLKSYIIFYFVIHYTLSSSLNKIIISQF